MRKFFANGGTWELRSPRIRTASFVETTVLLLNMSPPTPRLLPRVSAPRASSQIWALPRLRSRRLKKNLRRSVARKSDSKEWRARRALGLKIRSSGASECRRQQLPRIVVGNPRLLVARPAIAFEKDPSIEYAAHESDASGFRSMRTTRVSCDFPISAVVVPTPPPAPISGKVSPRARLRNFKHGRPERGGDGYQYPQPALGTAFWARVASRELQIGAS
jgi:hypothetical protein